MGDTNKNGRIDLTEFTNMLKDLDMKVDPFPLFKLIAGKSPEISLMDWVKAYNRFKKRRGYEKMTIENGLPADLTSGPVVGQFCTLIQNIIDYFGTNFGGDPNKMFKAILEQWDTNKNGRIDLTEFTNMLKDLDMKVDPFPLFKLIAGKSPEISIMIGSRLTTG